MEPLKNLNFGVYHLKQAAQALSASSTILGNAVSNSFNDVAKLGPSISCAQPFIGVAEPIQPDAASSCGKPENLGNPALAIVPVKHLPPEVLSTVFVYVTAGYCRFNFLFEVSPLLSIIAVCSYWRQVALNTSSLWSHVDVYTASNLSGVETAEMLTELWLSRVVNNVQLHVHFQAGNGWQVPDSVISWAISILKPYAAQISSLNFPSWSSTEFVCAILGMGGSDSILSLRSLFIDSPTSHVHAIIPWSGNLLCGLVSLQLSGIGQAEGSLSFDQLHAFLASSPAIRVIQLDRVDIVPSLESDLPILTLPSLRILDLCRVNQVALLQLLPVLSSGDSDLYFGVDIAQEEELAIVTATFIARTRITSLTLRQDYNDSNNLAKNYVCSTNHLHNLVLFSRLEFDMSHILEDLISVRKQVGVVRDPRPINMMMVSTPLDKNTRTKVMELVKMQLCQKIVYLGYYTSLDKVDEIEEFFDRLRSQENIEVIEMDPFYNSSDIDEGGINDVIQRTLLERVHWA
ncbi:pyrolysin [Ceratobasidium sp. AG-Ba]|nr:pyrolysin [Ceratobasidium sp. AG-Ba]